MNRLYQPPLPDLTAALDIVGNLPKFLSGSLPEGIQRAERCCFDRYLQLLNALEERSLFDCSLVDLGCAGGFFSYLFAITLCRHVTAVEDGRSLWAGYSKEAVLQPLFRAKKDHELGHLEIVEAAIEEFLTAHHGRQWDVVLCLSVLHHFFTGYGDDTQRGRLTEEERGSVFQAIGRATGTVLFLEVDHSRVPEDFVAEFVSAGEFRGYHALGSSASAVGDSRVLFEVWK